MEEIVVISKIASPVVGIEGVNKVVKTLYSYKKPGTYKDISAAAQLQAAYVSQALSASRDIGLTTLAGKRGLYVLTHEGEDYCRLLTAGKESDCKKLLHQVLLSNPLWQDPLAFLKANFGTKRDPLELIIDVERKLGKKWSQAMRKRVLDSYVSIFRYAELVKIEDAQIVSQIGEELIQSSEEPTVTAIDQDYERKVQPAAENMAEFKFQNLLIRIVPSTETLKLARQILDALEKQLVSSSLPVNTIIEDSKNEE